MEPKDAQDPSRFANRKVRLLLASPLAALLACDAAAAGASHRVSAILTCAAVAAILLAALTRNHNNGGGGGSSAAPILATAFLTAFADIRADRPVLPPLAAGFFLVHLSTWPDPPPASCFLTAAFRWMGRFFELLVLRVFILRETLRLRNAFAAERASVPIPENHRKENPNPCC
jgi:hypothetical protein